MADGCNIVFSIVQIPEERGYEFSTSLGVANFPLTLTFFLAADIVQEGSGSKDGKTCFHFSANGYGSMQDPLTMVWAMRASFHEAERGADRSEVVQMFGGKPRFCSGHGRRCIVGMLFTEKFLHQPAETKQQQFLIITCQPLQLLWR